MTLLLAYAGINVIAFLVFGWDKLCAIRDWSRAPEWQLLALAVFGGALGALLGQQIFRHKTQKQPFRTLLWCAAVINILAAIALSPDLRGLI